MGSALGRDFRVVNRLQKSASLCQPRSKTHAKESMVSIVVGLVIIVICMSSIGVHHIYHQQILRKRIHGLHRSFVLSMAYGACRPSGSS